MARRKGTLNRMELRDQAEAAERQTEEGEEEEDVEDDEDADEEEAEELDEDGEPRRKKKKAKKKPAKVEKPKATRSRARSAKIIRQRIVWGVFNNSNQRVATFEYPKRAEADAQAAKLSTDKK